MSRVLSVRKIRKLLMRWGRENYAEFPWRSTTSSFHALLAEVMLQRTRAEQVAPIFSRFAALYPSPREALVEDPCRIRALLGSLGLKWRAEKIIELVRVLNERDGTVPSSLKELMSLPGVGRYAASSYLSLHANVKASIVDSNAVRLWGRVFCLRTDAETRRKQWFLSFVDRITPRNDFRVFNYAVLDLTRKVCRPKPLHDLCPIASLCGYYRRICE
jgi:A/G-specific adenine glycosylase